MHTGIALNDSSLFEENHVTSRLPISRMAKRTSVLNADEALAQRMTLPNAFIQTPTDIYEEINYATDGTGALVLTPIRTPSLSMNQVAGMVTIMYIKLSQLMAS
jgi:hypothetical protein